MKDQTNRKLFKHFILDKTSCLICFSSLLLFFFVYIIFFTKKDLSIFPSKTPIKIVFYNDSIDGGNSIIEKSLTTDSLISMNFVLQKGFVRPYVGITLFRENGRDIDISAYNQITIEAKCNGLKNILIYMVTRNDSMINQDVSTKEIYFNGNVEMRKNQDRFAIDLVHFKIPDWWYDINNLSPKQNILPDWTHCKQISIATGLPPKIGTSHHIEINSITFTRNNTLVILSMIIGQLLVVVLAFLIYLFRKKQKRTDKIVISYKPIIVKNSQIETKSCFDYINENFHDSTLSLETVSKKTGMNQRNISEAIFNKYQCNFKTYINQIRIAEAQRLLKESKLTISEIAYSVGFSSPSNFNRVFKKLTGKAPSEYIQNTDI